MRLDDLAEALIASRPERAPSEFSRLELAELAYREVSAEHKHRDLEVLDRLNEAAAGVFAQAGRKDAERAARRRHAKHWRERMPELEEVFV